LFSFNKGKIMTDAVPHLKNPELGKMRTADAGSTPILRIRSQDLFQQAREVQIEHDGRIYRLRLTQRNKLILNA
jgi:hemin uptake protein HemP